MTDDDALHVQILSGEGGMQNELKISDEEDLQVAVEVLQLAARYQFGDDFRVETGPNQGVDQLAEELSEIDGNVAELIEVVDERTSSAVDEERFQKLEESVHDIQKVLDSNFTEFQNLNERLERLSEMMQNQEQVDSSRSSEDESEGEPEAESVDTGDDLQDEEPAAEEVQEADEEEHEDLDLSRMKAESILEEDLIEIDTPYSYEEFKDLPDAKQRAVLYDAVLTIQPATKIEVADHVLDSEVTDSNGKRAQYVGYRLDNKVSNLSRRRRPTDQGKAPWEFAEHGFDFEGSPDQEEEEDVETDSEEPEESEDEEDTETSDEEKSSVERSAAAMAEDAPPSEDADEGAYGFEWKTVEEAIEDYKKEDDKNYLLCIRSMKSFTAPISAKTHSQEDEGEVWAAAEKLPDDFLQ